jgi:hypothetical protein
VPNWHEAGPQPPPRALARRIDTQTTAKIAPMPVQMAISPRDMENPPSDFQRRMSTTLLYADMVSSKKVIRLLRQRFELVLMMIDLKRMMDIAPA